MHIYMRSKQLPLVTTVLLFWTMFSICFGSKTVPRAHSSTLVRRAELTRLPQNRWTIGSPRQACRVGLYMYKDYIVSDDCAAWEGIPLSTDERYGNMPLLDGICYRVTELNPELKPAPSWRATSSGTVVVQGYCNCIIYEDDMCGQGLKPQDIRSYPMQNMIRSKDDIARGSIQCFKDIGWESFESCSVKLSDGTTHPPLFNADEKGNEKWEWKGKYLISINFPKGSIDKITGESNCATIGGVSLRSWEIQGCTCHLYTDEACQKRYITYGGKGVRRVEHFDSGDLQQVRSIRCDLPWSYDPMDSAAFRGSAPRCVNLHPNGQTPNYQIKPFR
ncbi:hypothetical protein AOL_s00078g358 [Orbilia oligospora ATCC 24927]|uniref:Uncharacterized protein n=1 Tax=Arthrobotrys oligospora (strain ATCC 24927 / CBS 115.81 / DSM 1491) TaxID=756982 RepID=G1XBR1_ARTOA|nr:hypothetical protein AOL_s00078g358 [Orbilia oligospora ATCC 24927]EGX49325.1 hypothetical protein AOL_s00078g358 [Orbilia oligospora ATCC 24927]